VSLGFSAINTAEEVWMVVAGSDKAPAVARSLSGDTGPDQLPSGRVHGRRATRWLLDAAAAGKLPSPG
jgi:6-phosphogluconolactonase